MKTKHMFYTQELEKWSKDTVAALKGASLPWIGISRFFERSKQLAQERGQFEWAGLLGILAEPIKEIAQEEDAKWKAYRAKQDGELALCKAGRCDHARLDASISATFDFCEKLWPEVILLDAYDKGLVLPGDMPAKALLTNDRGSSALTMLLAFQER